MTIVNKMYEGVRYGIGLIDTSKPISMDMYRDKTGRVSWYVEDSIEFIVRENKLIISSKRGEEHIWSDDLEGYSIKVEGDCDVSVVIEVNNISYIVFGKLKCE